MKLQKFRSLFLQAFEILLSFHKSIWLTSTGISVSYPLHTFFLEQLQEEIQFVNVIFLPVFKVIFSIPSNTTSETAFFKVNQEFIF